jgi:heme/copper-type cytochrome/quinol oxidase subunit 2
MVATCALYGGSTYVNSWLGINVLVILIAFLAIAVVYSLSTIFSERMKSKVRDAARSELTQAVISAVILAILLGFVLTVCNISVAVTQPLLPAKYGGLNPFQYADYYIGNLSLNTGLNLLTSLYGTSVQYAVEAQVLQTLGAIFNSGLSGAFSTLFNIIKGNFNVLGVFSIAIAAGVHLSVIFTYLSDLYLSVSVLVTLAIGILFVQFLLLPVMQYAAFAIVLPIALAMRSLAFMGNSLRRAANSILALAIIMYMVYPLTIAFNGYAIAWIFSAQNPSSQYLHSTYIVPTIAPNPFFSSTGALTTPNPSGFAIFGNFNDKVASLIGPVFKNFIITPSAIMAQLQLTIDQVAQFLFAAVFLMVIDLAIVMGFAIGLTKALNGGVEGADSFWSGI